jgi:acetyltransferase-like isoleucine patch superfamily enzyme
MEPMPQINTESLPLNKGFSWLGYLHFLYKTVRRGVLIKLYGSFFGAHGKNFSFDPDGAYYYCNIYVGDDVSLGAKPILLATRSLIHIGNKVMFGPEVTIIGGNRNTSYVGKFMADVTDNDKKPEDDLGVVIDDDVWIGARAVILNGVTIGRGAIVAAGAVVTRSAPPYSIIAGVPAKVVKFRWDIDTILRHEENLYPPEKRFSHDYLEKCQSESLQKVKE